MQDRRFLDCLSLIFMNPEIKRRPTWAEIDLDNLAFNFKSVKEFVGDEIIYMAVVKADAYGHGAVECSKRLEREGIDWFGVALVEEGIELREAGVLKRILCLGGFFDGQEMELLDHDLTPVIFRLDQAKRINKAAETRGTVTEIHVKVDTGMNRVGVRMDELEDFARGLKKFEHLHLEGVMTHFASADDLSENEFTQSQIEHFENAVKTFEGLGFKPSYKDLANSPASVAHPESRGNMVRLGGVLYGLGGDVLPKGIPTPELKPVLSLHSKIAHLKNILKGETIGYSRTFTAERDMRVATVPIGYQDGYRRVFSNKVRAIVDNSYAPVVGRISMDWTILDVTDVGSISVGDEVLLIGETGDLSVSAVDLARSSDTISYEITCGISKRVKRSFSG